MHAGLGSQPAISVIALDLHGGALDARHLARVRVDHFGREATGDRPTQIHAQQHLGPILGLGTARAGLNIKERAVRVHLAVKHALQFEAPDVGFQSLRVLVDVVGGGLVALTLRQLQKLAGVRDPLGGAVDLGCIGTQPGALAPQLLGLLGLGPNGWVLELAADLFEPLFLAVILKETPVRSGCAPRDL
jgi:hypothetical protein